MCTLTEKLPVKKVYSFPLNLLGEETTFMFNTEKITKDFKKFS